MFYLLYNNKDNSFYSLSRNLKTIKVLQYWLAKHHVVFSTVKLDSDELINEKNYHLFKFDDLLPGNLQWDIDNIVSLSFLKTADIVRKTNDEKLDKDLLLKINIITKFLDNFVNFINVVRDRSMKNNEHFIKSLEIYRDLLKLDIGKDSNIDKIFNDDIDKEKTLIIILDNILKIVIKKILDIDYRNINPTELKCMFNDIDAFFNYRSMEHIVYSKFFRNFYNEHRKQI